jgi:hypothetical protein
LNRTALFENKNSLNHKLSIATGFSQWINNKFFLALAKINMHELALAKANTSIISYPPAKAGGN